AKIQARGNIIIGVKNNLRPLGFVSSEGKLQGLEIDIAKKLAEEILGKPEAVVFKPLTNTKRLQSVIDEQVDLSIGQVTVTKSRSRIVRFSLTYYTDSTNIISRNKKFNQLSDFKKGTLLVLNNSYTVALIKAELPQAKLIGVDSYEAAWQSLEAGEADGFVGDKTVLVGWRQEYPQYHLIPFNYSAFPLAIVMPKGLQYKDLHEKVDQAIAKWLKTGWLQARIKYWGLD
ncbi:MAG: ABC transporter substrate-binding protein, partial [Cyanobacteria bacterium J149]